MLRTKITLTILMIMVFIKICKSQDFWEVLSVPDTLHITSIVVNDDDEIFLSTNNEYCEDGIYKSVNGGYTWEKVFNSGQYGFRSMAISDSGVLYALGQYGVDLLKSVDNGDTWTALNVPEFVTNVEIFLKGEDTIFVSQWRDEGAFLLRSIDGGQSWDLVLHDYSVGYIIDLDFGSEGTLYAGVMCYMPDGGGIYKSSDNGTNWEFLGLYNHQISSISVDSQNNLLITVWSNMIDIFICGIFYYDKFNNEFSQLYGSMDSWGSAINSKDEYFATFHYGTLYSNDQGQSFEIIDGAAGCDLYLTKDQYIYGYAPVSNYLVKTTQSTVTSVSDIRNETRNILTVTPNPVKDQLNGRVSISNADCKGWINIIDTKGSAVYHRQVLIVDGNFKFDVSNLTQGLYIITLLINGSIYSARFVKG